MSASSKSKSTRPLGILRTSGSYTTGVLKRRSSDSSVKHGLNIHGESMTVPPPKPSTDKEPVIVRLPHPVASNDVSLSDKTPVAALNKPQTETKCVSEANQSMHIEEHKEQISESESQLIEEKQALTDELDALRRLIAELQCEIEDQKIQIADLQEDVLKQIAESACELNAEKERHSVTRTAKMVVDEELCNALAETESVRTECEKKIAQITIQMAEKMTTLTAEHAKDIEVRDDKITRLKQQMAEVLKGNSWERQQQLEELTKELTRIQNEAESLRSKLKGQKVRCSGCKVLTEKLDKMTTVLNEKEQSLNEMSELCARFEKQLKQQDQLIAQYAISKGHKIAPIAKYLAQDK